MSRFSEILLEHARRPRNFGRDLTATAIGKADYHGSPPRVEIFLTMRDNKIAHSSFYAEGCGVTIGLASALLEHIAGRATDHVKRIDSQSLMAIVDGIPSDKSFCVEVVLNALQAALIHQATKWDH